MVSAAVSFVTSMGFYVYQRLHKAKAYDAAQSEKQAKLTAAAETVFKEAADANAAGLTKTAAATTLHTHSVIKPNPHIGHNPHPLLHKTIEGIINTADILKQAGKLSESCKCEGIQHWEGAATLTYSYGLNSHRLVVKIEQSPRQPYISIFVKLSNCPHPTKLKHMESLIKALEITKMVQLTEFFKPMDIVQESTEYAFHVNIETEQDLDFALESLIWTVRLQDAIAPEKEHYEQLLASLKKQGKDLEFCKWFFENPDCGWNVDLSLGLSIFLKHFLDSTEGQKSIDVMREYYGKSQDPLTIKQEKAHLEYLKSVLKGPAIENIAAALNKSNSASGHL